MGKEIEKKYLLRENGISYATGSFESLGIEGSAQRAGEFIRQGYMPLEAGRNLGQKLGLDTGFQIAEARLRAKGSKFFLTLKGDGTISREEQERAIDQQTFEENWPFTIGKRIEKTRLGIPYEGLMAEIDFYADRDLITAEVECPDLETAEKLRPLGKDITEDKRYKNKNLAN